MQAPENYPLAGPKNSPRTVLAEGGFTADTEIMTTTGPVMAAELTSEDSVLALNPTTRMVKPKEVVQVQTIHDVDEIIALETRRCDFRLAPDHPFFYTTKAISKVRKTTVADLQQWFQRRFVNEWQPRSGTRLEEVDITDFVDDYEICAASEDHGIAFRAALPDDCTPIGSNSYKGCLFDPDTFTQYQSEIESVADRTTIHSGSNSRRRPYRFEGDDFIEFLGWFIAEGSVSWTQSRDTPHIQLAQKDERHRPKIASLFERLGIKPSVTNNGFSFGSTVFGTMLDELCGHGSKNKRIPSFIWNVSSPQKQLLFETLMFGDGTDQRTYYTTSEELAGDVLRLSLELGSKPRYTKRGDMWRIFVSSNADGFRSGRNLDWEANSDPLYRVTIEDFSLVMAGRNGKFQWVGASGIV